MLYYCVVVGFGFFRSNTLLCNQAVSYKPAATAFYLYTTTNYSTVRMNEQQTLEQKAVSRRRFLGYAGALAGVGIAAGMIGCKKDPDPLEGTIDLGSGDFGTLNLLYAIKQVQVVFYQRVVNYPYNALKATDKEFIMIERIRLQKLAQREVLRKMLSNAAIKDLEMDFTNTDFTKRTSVLSNSIFLEELSVTAFNGAAQLLNNDDYLMTVAKIASVEARHATAFHNTSEFGTFTDDIIVDKSSGLDGVRNPSGVVPMLHTFLKDRLNPANLPSS
jgi:hypothetical protein